MKHSTIFIPIIAALAVALLTRARGDSVGEELRHDVERAMSNLASSDSTLTNFLERAAGYAVFPNVRRSGVNRPETVVRGIVFEKGKPVGEALLAESNLKAQDSTTPFHEVIFFESVEALENFKRGQFVMSPDIGAVAAVEGAALTARYRKGVAVFAVPKSGLLESITIGDQQFSYKPLDESPVQITHAKRTLVPRTARIGHDNEAHDIIPDGDVAADGDLLV